MGTTQGSSRPGPAGVRELLLFSWSRRSWRRPGNLATTSVRLTMLKLSLSSFIFFCPTILGTKAPKSCSPAFLTDQEGELKVWRQVAVISVMKGPSPLATWASCTSPLSMCRE